MPLVIIKESETESVIKVYHGYMNDWEPILGKKLSTRPEPKMKLSNLLWQGCTGHWPFKEKKDWPIH